MRIFVDESGTFTAQNSPVPQDSWCTVACYVSPESDAAKLDALMLQLRQDCGTGVEAKINQISEARYIRWLRDIGRLSGVAFAVAVDISLHDQSAVEQHRDAQAGLVVEHLDRLIHDKPKVQLRQLSSDIGALPLQLYTQLQCQVELFHRVIQRATLYYAQFKPETLSRFTWRVDRKGIAITKYEDAFRRILASLLQTASIRDPLINLIGANYEHLARFEYPDGEFPTYLRDEYGVSESGDGLNVGMLVNEDFQFVDSAENSGIQVADLIASGLRRLLRGKWEREHEIALGLGSLFVKDLRGRTPIQLISLGREQTVSPSTRARLATLESRCRPLLDLRASAVSARV